jgi:hypothetical protein
MKANIFRVTGYIAFALLVSGASAQSEPLAGTRLAPDEFKWNPTPYGGQRVNLAGDEQKPGMYIYRVRFPTNFKVQPEIDKAGRDRTGWCFVADGCLVAGDVLLAQKIALETDESGALGVAKNFVLK